MQSHATNVCPACGNPILPYPGRRTTHKKTCSVRCARRLQFGDPVERFWSKVDRSGGDDACWPWMGYPRAGRYGRCKWQGKQIGAHVVAWMLSHGPVPDGLFVCHNCPGGDNPRCCNARHLWIGTALDNSRDAVAKGRIATGERQGTYTHPESRARGARHGSRTHPERLRRGDEHPARLRPDYLARGDEHWAKRRPDLIPRGERCHSARLTESQVREVRQRYAGGETTRQLANAFDLPRQLIWRVVTNKCWKHVGQPPFNSRQ